MHDIAEFLKDRDPFGSLDEAALEQLAREVEVEYFPAGATIFREGERAQDAVRVVRRGAVELLAEGRVLDLLGEGEMFGHPSMLSGLPTGFEARAEQDSLCYRLPAGAVLPLLAHPGGLRFLARSLIERGSAQADRLPPGGAEIAQQPASTLVRRPASRCAPDLPIREAARKMVAEGTGSLLIDTAGGPGIVTDRDLRAKVVAAGRSADDPVREVMSHPVITVSASQTGADVMLAMLDNDIHHVPVLSAAGEVLGVVSDVDLLAAETRSPFVLRRAIAEAAGPEDLRELSGRLRSTVVSLHDAGVAAPQVTQVISVVADALIRRMIELGVAAEGPPPVEFAWIALGSHGRREAALSSDVDSGLAWSDPPAGEGERVEAYLRALAAQVAGCVEAIGWRLDAHGVTAAGVFAAHAISDWRRIIPKWLSDPTDERVLIATSILLDGRPVYGPEHGLDPAAILHEAEHTPALLRWMLRLALASKPPTGFLHNLVLAASGERRRTLDLKHGGLLPVTDVARYANLLAGGRATSTVERLRFSAQAGSLDPEHARTLEEAFGLFADLRLSHQVNQAREGLKPDDEIDPAELDALTRRYVRDAFREVAAVQRSLGRELSRPA